MTTTDDLIAALRGDELLSSFYSCKEAANRLEALQRVAVAARDFIELIDPPPKGFPIGRLKDALRALDEGENKWVK